MSNNHTMLKNVRISFPQLWHDDIKSENGEESVFPKGVTILLSKEKDSDAIKAVQAKIKEVIQSNSKVLALFKKSRMKIFKGVCFRGPGEESWREEYDGYDFLLKSSLKKGSKPPLVLLPSGEKATEETDMIYSGCRVHVKVEIWLQDNKYGRRINCKLIGIQFAAHDDPMDASYVSDEVASEGFDALPQEGDDFDALPPSEGFDAATDDTDLGSGDDNEDIMGELGL